MKQKKIKKAGSNSAPMTKHEKTKFAFFWLAIFSIVIGISILIGIAANGVLTTIINSDSLTPAALGIVAAIGGLIGLGVIFLIIWFIVRLKGSSTKSVQQKSAVAPQRPIQQPMVAKPAQPMGPRPVQPQMGPRPAQPQMGPRPAQPMGPRPMQPQIGPRPAQPMGPRPMQPQMGPRPAQPMGPRPMQPGQGPRPGVPTNNR